MIKRVLILMAVVGVLLSTATLSISAANTELWNPFNIYQSRVVKGSGVILTNFTIYDSITNNIHIVGSSSSNSFLLIPLTGYTEDYSSGTATQRGYLYCQPFSVTVVGCDNVAIGFYSYNSTSGEADLSRYFNAVKFNNVVPPLSIPMTGITNLRVYLYIPLSAGNFDLYIGFTGVSLVSTLTRYMINGGGSTAPEGEAEAFADAYSSWINSQAGTGWTSATINVILDNVGNLTDDSLIIRQNSDKIVDSIAGASVISGSSGATGLKEISDNLESAKNDFQNSFNKVASKSVISSSVTTLSSFKSTKIVTLFSSTWNTLYNALINNVPQMSSIITLLVGLVVLAFTTSTIRGKK